MSNPIPSPEQFFGAQAPDNTGAPGSGTESAGLTNPTSAPTTDLVSPGASANAGSVSLPDGVGDRFDDVSGPSFHGYSSTTPDSGFKASPASPGSISHQHNDYGSN
jgi:hypothetical protein